MKKFIHYIIKIVCLLFLTLCLLDIAYTQVYLTDTHRNKINSIYNTNKKNFDVIFLGSSRANNHFVPSEFEKVGLKSYNYGLSGSHLFETALMLELMIERNYEIKNVIIQVDLNISSDTPSPKYLAQFLPYIHNSKTVSNYMSTQSNYNYWLYVPFYRYIEFENVIGFREFFFTAVQKKSNNLLNGGYFALHGVGKKMKNNLATLEPKRNASYEKIKTLCKKNNIRLIAVTTPICENTKHRDYYFDKVTKVYPEIKRYDMAVSDDRYFASCGHMNSDGSRIFTKKILNDFFGK